MKEIQHPMKANNTTSNRQWWLKRIYRLILENLSEFDFTNSTLAEELSISERQLYRIVKELTGLSPNLYIRQIRLQEAYKFLQTGQFHTIRELALLVGYQKIEYFTRLFTAEFGVHPMEILKQNK
ncbi:MAG: AraC family transcriptional regulator [Chitinophagales bacterium]